MRKTTRSPFVAAALLLGVGLGACGSDPYALPDFDPSLGVDVSALTRTDSGLYYQDIALGDGPPVTEGDSVLVDYTGRLADGTTFDSGSFPFRVGRGNAVPGFDEGVSTMREGGRRLLVIPPDLGYGKDAFGPIPGNSTLVFDVTLVRVYDATSSGG
jgi:peptidylprolyl isomerase